MLISSHLFSPPPLQLPEATTTSCFPAPRRLLTWFPPNPNSGTLNSPARLIGKPWSGSSPLTMGTLTPSMMKARAASPCLPCLLLSGLNKGSGGRRKKIQNSPIPSPGFDSWHGAIVGKTLAEARAEAYLQCMITPQSAPLVGHEVRLSCDATARVWSARNSGWLIVSKRRLGGCSLLTAMAGRAAGRRFPPREFRGTCCIW